MRCLMDGNVNEGFVIEIGVKFNPVLLDECEAPDARIALELKAHLPHGYLPFVTRTQICTPSHMQPRTGIRRAASLDISESQ